jgi:hypothetical protein
MRHVGKRDLPSSAVIAVARNARALIGSAHFWLGSDVRSVIGSLKKRPYERRDEHLRV